MRDNTGTVVIANNAVFAQNGDAIFLSGGMPGMITVSGNAGVGGADDRGAPRTSARILGSARRR